MVYFRPAKYREYSRKQCTVVRHKGVKDNSATCNLQEESDRRTLYSKQGGLDNKNKNPRQESLAGTMVVYFVAPLGQLYLYYFVVSVNHHRTPDSTNTDSTKAEGTSIVDEPGEG